MFSFAIAHTQAASFDDFVPILFVIYVIYAIVSAAVKGAKQVRQAVSEAASTAPAPGQQVNADQVRAALARRLAAVKLPPLPSSQPTPVVVRLSSQPSALAFPVGAATNAQMDAMAPMSYSDPLGVISGSMDIAALLASLPPAAQAIVASAVIGPCAAHRGGGHVTEDW